MPSPHKTPFGANLEDAPALNADGRSDSTSLVHSTFGRFPGWGEATRWAQAHGVLSDLLLAIDSTRIAGAFNRLGTVLKEISTPTARDYLTTWDGRIAGVVPLLRLSNAVVRERQILTAYPPLPTERSARRQLLGNLQREYLLAMQLEQLPPGSVTEREWFVAMRLWIFVHSMRRAWYGKVSDINLRLVADSLRKAGDSVGDEWRSLIVRLHTPATDFLELNSSLSRMAERLREQTDHPVTETQARVLTAIVRIAHDEDAVDQRSNDDTPLLFGNAGAPSNPAGTIPKPQVLVEPVDENPEAAFQWPVPGKVDDDSDTATELQVPPEQSYEHQRLHAKAVLLASAEELQLLPWSSSRPNPYEATALDRWIEELLAQSDEKLQLLGSLVWVARHTGRSLKRALDVGISDPLQREWAYSPTSKRLERIPPIRYSSWLPASDAERAWVAPVADRNRLVVPSAIAKCLDAAIDRSAHAAVLGQLWQSQQSPEVFFREIRPAHLARVTPGMVGNLLPLELYANTGDAAFASLVASHPQSGLQAACAYGNWTTAQVEQAFNKDGLPGMEPGNQASDIGGGSRLDPIEALLRDEVVAAGKRIDELAANADTVTFHNAYTAYVAIVLLAATGVRPIRDPFEAYWHFDFRVRFCFVNDKESGDARAGRLIPVPKAVLDWIQGGYCRYLGLLARLLSDRHPALADAIDGMLAGHRPAKLPFLFFLTEDSGLTWTSVTPSAIEGLGLFRWPLPLNLFRQRLAKQLRRRQVDPELIDAILGHADNGAATHDDYSCRVWEADMREVRPAMDRAFESLQWPLPICHPRPLAPTGNRKRGVISVTDFGAESRAEARKARIVHAKEDAREIILAFLKGRQLADLDEDAVYELIKAVVFNESGMPRALARYYYYVLDADLEAVWKEKGKRLKVKRRFAWVRPTPSPFTDQAPGATQLLARCATRFDEALAAIQPSRVSLRALGVLGPLVLLIDHGLCDVEVLDDVSRGQNFRIVRLGGRIDLEYSPQMEGRRNDPDLPVRRFPISPRAASLLGHLIGGKKKVEPLKGGLPVSLDRLLDELSQAKRSTGQIETGRDLVDALVPLVDQVNAMIRPAVIAGYLAGRVLTYSLGWRDRVRLELGFIPRFGNFDQSVGGSPDGSGDGGLVGGPSARSARDASSESLIANAREFYGGLRKELSPYLAELPKSVGPEKRRDVAARMNACIREWNGKVGTAVLLLGKWLASLVFRPKRSGAPLAMGTIGRYFSSLSPVFEKVAYGTDLLALDEEGVTGFYVDIIETHGAEDRQFAGARLAEFHRWARQEGVEDPDWSELPEVAHVIHVSPGVVTEGEYQQALQLTIHDTSCDAATALATAFLMLCCYRFGLRGAEVLGLLRSDWSDHGDGKIVIFVRENRFRATKVRGKQRQVPLLFRLSSLEQNVVHRWQALAAARHGDKEYVPVFAGGAVADGVTGVHQLTRRANQILKVVTDNPFASLHRLRHSAANKIGLELIWPEAAHWQRLSNWEGVSANRADIERMLLLRSGPTRRKVWAVSAFLGHASGATSFKSYLHFVPDWTRATDPTGFAKPAIGAVENLIELDGCERAGELSIDLLTTTSRRREALTIASALQLLRRIGSGKDVADLADALAVDPQRAEALSVAAAQIGGRMRLTPKAGLAKEAKALAREFLIRVTDSGWRRLLELATIAQERCERQMTEENEGGHVDLSDVIEMVGATRQILMWKPKHFDLIRSMCSMFAICNEHYDVIRSNTWDDRIEALARAENFSVKGNDEVGGKKPVQLDSAWEGENRNRVERRCAFLFRENSDFAIRNRLELAVLLLAFAAAIAR